MRVHVDSNTHLVKFSDYTVGVFIQHEVLADLSYQSIDESLQKATSHRRAQLA